MTEQQTSTDPGRSMAAAAADLLAALRPLCATAFMEAARLRFQARGSTSGLARALIEAAQRWEEMHGNAMTAIAKATAIPPRIEGFLSSPTFMLGEDDTGGPCFFWTNPWSGEREKIASLWWPTHPAEATEAIEKLFERLQLSTVGASP